MLKKFSLLKPVALAALCVAASASQAAITVYTTQASFLAAVVNARTDSFSDISLFAVTPAAPGPLMRSVAPYGYTASSDNVTLAAPDTFFGAGTVADPWLSTTDSRDTITFSAFTGGVRAVGGNFFGSNQDGAYLAGTITLTVTDSTTSLTRVLAAPTTTSFIGFVSTTGTISSLVVASDQSSALPLFATVDNLMLAVPEPQTYALLLAGLGLVGLVARRRG